MKPEEILQEKMKGCEITVGAALDAMREYARQERDKALTLASEFCQVEVDQLAVLELKEHPDLAI